MTVTINTNVFPTPGKVLSEGIGLQNPAIAALALQDPEIEINVELNWYSKHATHGIYNLVSVRIKIVLSWKKYLRLFLFSEKKIKLKKGTDLKLNSIQLSKD